MAKVQQVKCRVCKESGDKSEMVEKNKGWWYHPHCQEKVPCKQCKEFGDSKDMVDVQDGVPKVLRGWYHSHCYANLKEERESTDKDNAERDELSDTIKRIHGVISTPNWMWIIFDAWHKGEAGVYRGKPTNKPKMPIEYTVLTEAYKIAEKDIEWAKKMKSFDGSNAELAYGYKVMCSKINDAYRKLKHKKEVEKQATQATTAQIEVEHQVDSANKQRKKYQTKKRKGDISALV